MKIMNREIKFKAWHTETEQMLFVGDAFGTTHPLDCAVYAKSGQDLILLQFTGLKDKNGKEIYEGDIVQFDVTMDSGGPRKFEYGVVRFSDSGFWTSSSGTESEELLCEELEFEFLDPKVIGNRFENPDLLTK
jgi:uncharacterized phage protein (TIGR01671 family)